jgi:hypothetical protein
MGSAFADGDGMTRWKVLRLVPNGYLKRAFNNDEVFRFIVMGVAGYAYLWVRFDFENQICAARVAGGSSDLEPLSRRGLQPFALHGLHFYRLPFLPCSIQIGRAALPCDFKSWENDYDCRRAAKHVAKTRRGAVFPSTGRYIATNLQMKRDAPQRFWKHAGLEPARIMIRRYDRQDGGLRLPPLLFELRRTSRLQPALGSNRWPPPIGGRDRLSGKDCGVASWPNVIRAVRGNFGAMRPIRLSGRKPLVTLRDEAEYIMEFPEAEHWLPHACAMGGGKARPPDQGQPDDGAAMA